MMDDKTKYLVSLGASIASNCVPCFEYYYNNAKEAGLTDEEITIVIELAEKVKRGSGINTRNKINEFMGIEDSDETSNGNPCESSSSCCC